MRHAIRELRDLWIVDAAAEFHGGPIHGYPPPSAETGALRRQHVSPGIPPRTAFHVFGAPSIKEELGALAIENFMAERGRGVPFNRDGAFREIGQRLCSPFMAALIGEDRNFTKS
jgi:hypothetical protein